MVTVELQRQVSQLSVEDRFELARYILDSGDLQLAATPEVLARANNRLDQMLSGQTEPVTASNVAERVRARLAVEHVRRDPTGVMARAHGRL